jgi:hypothetical protein
VITGMSDHTQLTIFFKKTKTSNKKNLESEEHSKKILFLDRYGIHACNPSTWEAETGGSRVRGSLSYMMIPWSLKQNKTKLFLSFKAHFWHLP